MGEIAFFLAKFMLPKFDSYEKVIMATEEDANPAVIAPVPD
jgi:hypothetical protein